MAQMSQFEKESEDLVSDISSTHDNVKVGLQVVNNLKQSQFDFGFDVSKFCFRKATNVYHILLNNPPPS